MTNPYPLISYTITYNYNDKQFYAKGIDGTVCAQGAHGRELGRDLWDRDAEQVVYDYDLGLDEWIPLRLRHEYNKNKT